MSCFCMPSSAPAGVMRAMALASWAVSGLRKRSRKGACSSISVIVLRLRRVASIRRCSTASRLGGEAAPRTVSSTPKKARKPASAGSAPLMVSMCVLPWRRSDLDVHDLADGEEAGEHHERAAAEHHPAAPDGLGEDAEHVVRVDDAQEEGEGDGQAGDDVAGELLLGGEDLDGADELDALADGIGDGVEHFDEVAADFALDVDGGDEELEVLGLHALDEVGEGLFGGEAEADLAHDALELFADGVGAFAGDELHRLQEAEAGAEGAGHDGDDVGELAVEEGLALLALAGDPVARAEVAGGEEHEGQQD